MHRYHIKAFTARGDLLLHTTHASEASRDVETAVWRDRLRSSDDSAAYVEVIDTRTGKVERVYSGGAEPGRASPAEELSQSIR